MGPRERLRRFHHKTLRPAILGPLILAYYRLIEFSCRRVVIGGEHPQTLRARKIPRVYAAWHTNVFFAPTLGRDEPRAAALVSGRGVGPLFDRVIRALGHKTIRGSSTRRGTRALRKLTRHLERGGCVAMIPDGPRGPAYVLKPGIIALARLAGAAIIPTHFECTRQYRRRGWDRQRIPLPFGTMVVRFGEPIHAARDADPAELQRRVQSAMRDNRLQCLREARRLAGRKHKRRPGSP